MRLPWTAKDVFSLSPRDWLLYNGVIVAARATGMWRYPIAASGDIETMQLRDLIYWLYKAQFPVVHATKGAGLEAYFADNAQESWRAPDGFVATAEATLSAAGDLMDHPYLPRSRDVLYEQVAETIFGADVAMANLECVVYPQGTGSFTIRPTAAPPLYYKRENFEAARGYQERMYTCLATANNHSLDCGEDGVRSTTAALRDAGIAYHGMNATEADVGAPAIVTCRGITFGVLSHTFGLNAKRPPSGKPWIVNRAHLNGRIDEVDFGLFERQLAACRTARVDIVIAQLHWGMEHEYWPRPTQLHVAHHLAELGCDIVIGHHPHVVQPLERYRTRRDPHRVVPIYYSLGNLVNPFSHPAFRIGGIGRIEVVKGTCSDGTTRAYVRAATREHVFQDIDERRQCLRLVPASGDQIRSLPL